MEIQNEVINALVNSFTLEHCIQFDLKIYCWKRECGDSLDEFLESDKAQDMRVNSGQTIITQKTS